MEEVILKTEGIVKTYNGNRVLNDLSMTINRGDIYGFVGENGSGKTTVIRVVTGLIKFEAGSYQLFGIDSKNPEILKARKKISAIVESPSIYTNMNAKDNLRMQSMILGIQDEGRIQWALDIVGLRDLYESNKLAGNFSLGMRQRLGIAMALLSQAEFLILDEPLNGLDPEGIVEVRNLILKLNKEFGITFLISSHILTELSLVATKYGIISKGHLIKEITQEELKNQCEKYIKIETTDKKAIYDALLSLVDKENIKEFNNGYIIPGDIEYSSVLSHLQGLPITAINTETTSIEDYYLRIIKGGRENA